MALSGIVVLVSLHVRVERRAGPPVLPDLYVLTEKMPVDQRTAPLLA